MATRDVDREPLSRAEKIVEGHQLFFEGCHGLESDAAKALRLAASAWMDETTFTADPLGPLWPEGIAVAGAAHEEVSLARDSALPAAAEGDRIEALLAERLRTHRDRMLAVDHPARIHSRGIL